VTFTTACTEPKVVGGTGLISGVEGCDTICTSSTLCSVNEDQFTVHSVSLQDSLLWGKEWRENKLCTPHASSYLCLLQIAIHKSNGN